MPILPFLCALIAVTAAAQANDSAVRAQIEAAQQKWGKAWNERDLETMLNLYAEDAQSYSPDSGIAKGRAALRQRFERAFKPENHVPETATTLDVLAQGDFATETGTWISKSADASEQGSYLTVWRKIDGQWKVLREIYNSSGRTAQLPSSLRALEPLLGSWAGEAVENGNTIRISVHWKPSESGAGVIHEGTGWVNGNKILGWTELLHLKGGTKTLASVSATTLGEHSSAIVLARDGTFVFQQTGVNEEGDARLVVNQFTAAKDTIRFTQRVSYRNGEAEELFVKDFELNRVP